MKKEKPLVSILIPVWNEEKHIESSINSLLSQDYPKDKIEILIADGKSSDNTVNIIQKLMSRHNNIKLFNNPHKNTAIGRNICLRNSTGKYVVNFSAHAFVQKEFIKTLVDLLDNSSKEVAGVGCSNFPPNPKTVTAKAIAAVYSSIMGGIKSVDQNYKGKKECFAKSIAFTMYKRKTLEEINGFDPRFWVGQDGELNLRLRKKKYKLIYTPETKSYRYNRDTVKKFFKQMYRYGIARSLIIKKHPDSFKAIFMIPSFFVLFIIRGIILSIFSKFTALFFIVILIIYVIFGMIFTAFVEKNVLTILISPIFYFIQHSGFGLGILRGFFKKQF